MIRALTPDDLDQFASVWRASLSLYPEAFLLTAEEGAKASAEGLIGRFLLGQSFGFFEDGALLGFVTFRSGEFAATAHSGDIGPLYVVPQAQRKGIARALMEHVFRLCPSQGILQLELSVDAESTAAIALYRALGFVEFGRRPRAVIMNGQARDDLLMMRMLDAPNPRF